MPALPTGWTLRNGIVVNDYLATSGGPIGAVVSDSASINFRFASKTLGGASTYTLTVTLYGQLPLGVDLFGFGVFLSDATKFESFEMFNQAGAANRLQVRQSSGVTSGGSLVAGPTANLAPPTTLTMRVVKDVTNRTFFYYSNGAFVQFFQEAASAFLTETEVGFGGICKVGGGDLFTAMMSLVDWSLV